MFVEVDKRGAGPAQTRNLQLPECLCARLQQCELECQQTRSAKRAILCHMIPRPEDEDEDEGEDRDTEDMTLLKLQPQ